MGGVGTEDPTAARAGCQDEDRNNAAHDPPALMCESRCASSATPRVWGLQAGLQASHKTHATSSGERADHTRTPRRVGGAQTTRARHVEWGARRPHAHATSSGEREDHTRTPRRVGGAQTTPDNKRGRRTRHDRTRQRRRAYESRHETATAEKET